MWMLTLSVAAGRAPDPPCNQDLYKDGHHVVSAEGRTPSEASVRAEARLFEKFCGAQTLRLPAKCDEIREAIGPGDGRPYRQAGRSYCATALVHERTVGHEDIESRLEADLDRLVAAIVAAVPHGVIGVAAPVWRTGAPSGPIGPVFVSRLQDAAVRAGITAWSDASFDARPAGAVLSLSLVIDAADRLVVTPSLRLPSGAPVALPTVECSAAALGLTRADMARGISDERLGLANGIRLGAEGLTAWLGVRANGGAVCAGARVDARLAVSADADAHVFVVDREGRAYHLWPGPETEAAVGPTREATVSLEATSAPDGDYRLVTVAAQRAQGLPWARWRGFCTVEGGWTDALAPAGVAVHASTWSVLDGVGGCPAVAEAVPIGDPSACR